MPRKRSKFSSVVYGADDIYLTKNKIAIRKVSTTNFPYKFQDKTKYYSKSKKNLAIAHKVYGHIRYGRG